MKVNYSVIGKDMIPRQRNILVEKFDKEGNIIDVKLESADKIEKIKSTEIRKFLKDQVERLDFRLEKILADSTLEMVPSLPNMTRYWLEPDGFVRGEKKYTELEPPAKISFMISKSLVEICVGESPDIIFFNELKKDLETCVDTPGQGQIINTTSEHVCVSMSNTYYTKPFIKESEKTSIEISQITERMLKKYPKLHVGNYSPDLPQIYYRNPPGSYEDEETRTCEPKDNSYNVSFRFGYWEAWFDIIISIEILPENELLKSFTFSLRDELFELFNSSINSRS
jgi:uncharacterized protein YuzE